MLASPNYNGHVDFAARPKDLSCGHEVADAHKAETGLIVYVFRRVSQHLEQCEENRQLEDQGKAAAERTDLVLLVELHHLLAHLLAVVLELLLDFLELGLEPLHGDH